MELGENPFDDLQEVPMGQIGQGGEDDMIEFDSSATFTMDDPLDDDLELRGEAPSPKTSSSAASSGAAASGGGFLGALTPSCCTLAYYQGYFDLTTDQAKDRLLRAYVPSTYRSPFFASESPDFYVPFWMATTLILVTTMTGNFAAWLSQPYDENGDSPVWHADFVNLYMASAIFYMYVSIVPVMISFALLTAGQVHQFAFVISLYGYALAVFLPICFFCTISADWLRWLLLTYAFLSSSFFLVRNLAEHHLLSTWEGVADPAEDPRELTLKERAAGKLVMLLIVGLQLLFACTIKFMFYPSGPVSVTP